MAITEITVHSLGELLDRCTPPEPDPVTGRRRDTGVYHGAFDATAATFEDTVIRSGDSEVEFRRLADSYKNEIWPGVYQEIDAANARFAAVARARDALVASLTARPGRPA